MTIKETDPMTARTAAENTDIIYEKRQGAAWITINRPETYNSLVGSTVLEITDSVTDAAEDPEIGVIVITGAGDKAFSSGGNLQTLNQRSSLDSRNHMRRLAHLGVALRTCGKPTIAAVNGYAVGGGHELHVMCDLTIAAEQANSCTAWWVRRRRGRSCSCAGCIRRRKRSKWVSSTSSCRWPNCIRPSN